MNLMILSAQPPRISCILLHTQNDVGATLAEEIRFQSFMVTSCRNSSDVNEFNNGNYAFSLSPAAPFVILLYN
jgi:hypothetical protein